MKLVYLFLVQIVLNQEGLKFKTTKSIKEAGLVELSPLKKKVEGQKPDDIVCSSKRFVGIVNIAAPMSGSKNLSTNYLALRYAGLFVGNKALLEAVLENQKKMKEEKVVEQMKDFIAGEIPGLIHTYKGEVGSLMQELKQENQASISEFKTSLKNLKLAEVNQITKFETALVDIDQKKLPQETAKPMLDEQYNDLKKSFELHLDLVDKEIFAYLHQSDVLNQKTFPTASIAAIQLINKGETSTSKIGDHKWTYQKAFLSGIQYGRSAVLVFRRKLKEGAEESESRYTYKMEKYFLPSVDYAIDSSSDIKGAFGLPLPPDEVKKQKKIEEKKMTDVLHEVQERDIILVLSKKVIDNLPIILINYLVNFACFRMSKQPDIDFAKDEELQTMVKDIKEKFGNLENIKYAYRLVSDQKKDGEKDNRAGYDIGLCPMEAFYPDLEYQKDEFWSDLWAHGKEKFKQENCVKYKMKLKYTMKMNKATPTDDPVEKNFDPNKMTEMFKYVMQEIMTQSEQKDQPDQPKQPNRIFFNYKLISDWKKAINAKGEEATKLKQTFVDGGEYTKLTFPAEIGEFTVFADMLVKNDDANKDENIQVQCSEDIPAVKDNSILKASLTEFLAARKQVRRTQRIRL